MSELDGLSVELWSPDQSARKGLFRKRPGRRRRDRAAVGQRRWSARAPRQPRRRQGRDPPARAAGAAHNPGRAAALPGDRARGRRPRGVPRLLPRHRGRRRHRCRGGRTCSPRSCSASSTRPRASPRMLPTMAASPNRGLSSSTPSRPRSSTPTRTGDCWPSTPRSPSSAEGAGTRRLHDLLRAPARRETAAPDASRALVGAAHPRGRAEAAVAHRGHGARPGLRSRRSPPGWQSCSACCAGTSRRCPTSWCRKRCGRWPSPRATARPGPRRPRSWRAAS